MEQSSRESGDSLVQVERANEDSHLEGLKGHPAQDVEQIRADMLGNETAGKAGMKRRTGTVRTLSLPQVGLEQRVKIPWV